MYAKIKVKGINKKVIIKYNTNYKEYNKVLATIKAQGKKD